MMLVLLSTTSSAIDVPPRLHVLQNAGAFFIQQCVRGTDVHLELLPRGSIRFGENHPLLEHLRLHHGRCRTEVDQIHVPTELRGEVLLERPAI